MLAVDGTVVADKTFPDNTPCLLDIPVPHITQKHIDITWCFDNMAEAASLYMLSCHYADIYPDIKQRLVMPYIPNARMDRVKDDSECFTLKWFARLLAGCVFDTVSVLDPHSPVSCALIEHARCIPVEPLIACAIEDYAPDIVFYPDTGAAKRYGDFGVPSAFGNKARDWKSGRLEKLDIIGDVDMDGARVLIVDDITSFGGTFHYASQALKQAGAHDVALYVSHAEKNVFAGKLFTENDISHLYTTDSILARDDVPKELVDKVSFVKEFRKVSNEHPTREEMRQLL